MCLSISQNFLTILLHLLFTSPHSLLAAKIQCVYTALALKLGFKLSGLVRSIPADHGVHACVQEVRGYKRGSRSEKDKNSGPC